MSGSLQWSRQTDSDRGNDFYIYFVQFKTGHQVFLQEDGDDTWSATICNPGDGFPIHLQTDLKDLDTAKKYVEDNALDIIPGLAEYLE